MKCAAVETVTLVDLLDARGDLTRGRLAHVFFLKVDVEGAEAVVLEGCGDRAADREALVRQLSV